MYFKKKILPVIVFSGIFLIAIFAVNSLLPLVINNRFVTAISEALTAVLCLMAIFSGVIYSVIKKQEKSAENLPGNASKLSTKKGKSGVRSMTVTG